MLPHATCSIKDLNDHSVHCSGEGTLREQWILEEFDMLTNCKNKDGVTTSTCHGNILHDSPDDEHSMISEMEERPSESTSSIGSLPLL
ncbi:hypothetical protein AAHA92_31994 [Salvia divinorum]|uniref:Uncharacterized protein n=1 Tax=Salvia divinorum TaxID=28513 RepID=A0ABD1FMC8_SALDI